MMYGEDKYVMPRCKILIKIKPSRNPHSIEYCKSEDAVRTNSMSFETNNDGAAAKTSRTADSLRRYTDYICPKSIVNAMKSHCAALVKNGKFNLDFILNLYTMDSGSQICNHLLGVSHYMTSTVSTNILTSVAETKNALMETSGALMCVAAGTTTAADTIDTTTVDDEKAEGGEDGVEEDQNGEKEAIDVAFTSQEAAMLESKYWNEDVDDTTIEEKK